MKKKKYILFTHLINNFNEILFNKLSIMRYDYLSCYIKKKLYYFIKDLRIKNIVHVEIIIYLLFDMIQFETRHLNNRIAE
jgi:hypothetical protein